VENGLSPKMDKNEDVLLKKLEKLEGKVEELREEIIANRQ
jgi:hypothetical protein